MIATKERVFVIDDDPSVRKGLTRLLRSASYESEVFASAADFLEREPYPGPACVVVDVRMPGLNGLEFQEALIKRRREEQLVFITGHGDVPMTVRAMKAGAVEFLTKPIDDEALLAAIRHAIERSIAAHAGQDEMRELRGRHASLTPRENEIMNLVVSGLLNKQVGYKLGISEITVKAHRGKVMQKMEADSLADLVKMAVRLGLTPSENPWHLTRGSDG